MRLFKFQEEASVALKGDDPILGLKAGDSGAVWAFDALIAEDELAASVAESPLSHPTRALIGAHNHNR